MAPLTLAIGGGKGGTGKSLLAVQLGIAFAAQGKKVVLIDADSNGANLHTFFGLEDPSKDIDGLLRASDPDPEPFFLPTGFQDLGLIAGSREEMQLRTGPEILLNASKRLRLASSRADIVLWDVGSGVSTWATYLFEQADVGLWVVVPEPTCVEREYYFLRHVCRWRLAPLLSEEELPPSGWLPVPWLSSIRREEPARAMALQERLRARPILLLGNQVQTPEEQNLPEEMVAVCQRFFAIHGAAIGALSFDERVWLSVRRRRPILDEFPDSRWIAQFQETFTRLAAFL